MKRTLTGIDVKILPEDQQTGDNPWDRAKIIEANGRNTGLTALNDESDGFKKFLRNLELDGKPLFIYHTPTTAAHGNIDTLARYIGHIDSLEGERYPFAQVTEWIHDLPRFYHKRRGKQFDKDPVSRYDKNMNALIAAAAKIDMPLQVATSWSFTPFGIRFYTSDTAPDVLMIREKTEKNNLPAENFIPWEKIGMTMGIHNSLFEKSVDENLFLNDEFSEEILGDKGIFTCLDDLFPELGINLQKYMPKSTLWGCGMGHSDELSAWFDESKSSKFVRKPLWGSQGRGVRFFGKEEFFEKYPHHIEDSDFTTGAYINLILDIIAQGGEVYHRSVIVQDFVPGITINYEERPYDACARAVVGNGSYIRGVWRLSLAALDSHANDEEKYRANTSLGSETVALTDEQDDLIATLSEAFVDDFFPAVRAVREKIDDLNLGLFENAEYYAQEQKLRILCYMHRLKKTAERDHQTIHLPSAIKSYIGGDLAERLLELYEHI